MSNSEGYGGFRANTGISNAHAYKVIRGNSRHSSECPGCKRKGVKHCGLEAARMHTPRCVLVVLRQFIREESGKIASRPIWEGGATPDTSLLSVVSGGC